MHAIYPMPYALKLGDRHECLGVIGHERHLVQTSSAHCSAQAESLSQQAAEGLVSGHRT